METNRRNFIKTAAVAGTALSVAPFNILRGQNLNSKVVIAAIGINGRGKSNIGRFVDLENVEIGYLCDPEKERFKPALEVLKGKQSKTPKTVQDFRKIIDNKDLDAVMIATPDHWHTPAAIIAASENKHVYVEKPCSHNCNESSMLVKAEEKYKVVMQMGNQRRSGPIYHKCKSEIDSGIIGQTTHAETWYARKRGGIGRGKAVAVPKTLDFDLWQGPAPRQKYTDNIVPYNWHWFKKWGTGEIQNNGLHEIDVARWMLGEKYPSEVNAFGNNIFRKEIDSDWEFYDTLDAEFKYESGKMISWTGRSSVALKKYGQARGVLIYGTKGYILMSHLGYTIHDLGGQVIKEYNEQTESLADATNTVSPNAGISVMHKQNFIDAIRGKAKLNSPMKEAVISTNTCELGNISYFSGKKLKVDPNTGEVANKGIIEKYWKREYEKGWEPVV